MPEASLAAVNFPAKAFYLLAAVGICASSSEARRQIQGGGVKLDGARSWRIRIGNLLAQQSWREGGAGGEEIVSEVGGAGRGRCPCL